MLEVKNHKPLTSFIPFYSYLCNCKLSNIYWQSAFFVDCRFYSANYDDEI